MSEDAHFSGDEPLFAQDNQRGPSKRYAFQRFDWDPNSCPCCGNLSMDEDYHEEEDYYDFPESWEEGPWYDPQDGDYL